MPSLIAYESWDGVSAPALPVGLELWRREPARYVVVRRPAGSLRSRRRMSSRAWRRVTTRTGQRFGRRRIRPAGTSWSSARSTQRRRLPIKPTGSSRASRARRSMAGRRTTGHSSLPIESGSPIRRTSCCTAWSPARRRCWQPSRASPDPPTNGILALARLPGVDDRRHAHAGERWVLPHQLGHVASRPDDGDQS